ncbi:HAD family hydrolase, partial [Streptomyces sp. wa22]|uniref:HAD family hydrolase n=3 Tax=Streptomyces TaxID=1883 RepID=UPI0011C762A3
MATPGKHRTHLVWDWNGTLLDDIHAVLGATNAAFAEVDLAPLTLKQYRETYCVPIPKFYERLMGRLPTPAEWERMDGLFHRHYTEQRAACGLTEGV